MPDIASPFTLKAKKHLDSRKEFSTLVDAEAYSVNFLPEGHLAWIGDKACLYMYTSSGGWTPFISGTVGVGINVQIVTALPTTDISTTTIYLLLEDTTNNIYSQHMYINSAWADLGTTSIDLSNYVTASELAAALSNYYTKENIDSMFENYMLKTDYLIDNALDAASGNPVENSVITKEIDTIYGKFMQDIQIVGENVVITYVNGNQTELSLTDFVAQCVASIGYGKAITCDSLPTCSLIDGEWIVTYLVNGVAKQISETNTWFYYLNSDNAWLQTLFVEGAEITIYAGTINSIIDIDPITKNWTINGVDTGVRAEGYTPTITENADNTDKVYKLDIDDGSGNVITTPNLHGIDRVETPTNGFYQVYVENGTLYLICEDSATPPPLSLVDGKLYYTMGGSIQYESVEYGVDI